MPTVSLDSISNGDSADATPVNNNFQEIQTAINSLDANNWGTGAILAPSKLTQEAATTGQGLAWNGTIWAPTSISAAALGQGGAATGEVLQWNGTAWDPVPLTGMMLGMVEYNPTTVVSASTTSTTGADVDATNLSLTVTVPSSGKLAVMQTAGLASAAGAMDTFWGLRESTTDVGYRKVTGSGGVAARVTIFYLLTGLSAAAHTYKWAFRAHTSGGGATANCHYGTATTSLDGDPGPATMAFFGVL